LLDYPESDESLLQAAGSGNMEAFAELVRRHQDWAWQIAYRFFGRKEQAADVVQDAFIRLLRASPRYRPTAKFRTYFHRIITRLCLDQAKKKRLPELDTMPDIFDPAPDAAAELMRRETAAAVGNALDALAPNQRMAIVLRYYEGLDYREIADALETTPKAAERLLARGRKRLRIMLKTDKMILRTKDKNSG